MKRHINSFWISGLILVLLLFGGPVFPAVADDGGRVNMQSETHSPHLEVSRCSLSVAGLVSESDESNLPYGDSLRRAAGSFNWSELSPDEQKVLKPFADRWQELAPEKQDKLRRGARRWKKMNFQERKLARERLKRWQGMRPEEREQARQRFKRFQQLPEEEKRKLRKARRWFRELPAERKQELKERWQQMSPDRRQEFRELRGQKGLERSGPQELRSDTPNGNPSSRGERTGGRR